ncbi:hypothetical protein CO725_02535 [Vibrio parahaemolyticus]|nr:hypothetical protein CO725_02535 [Vibrio parahaemolyticus]
MLLAYDDIILLQLSEMSLREQCWSIHEIEEGLEALQHVLPLIRNETSISSFSFVEYMVLKHLESKLKSRLINT